MPNYYTHHLMCYVLYEKLLSMNSRQPQNAYMLPVNSLFTLFTWFSFAECRNQIVGTENTAQRPSQLRKLEKICSINGWFIAEVQEDGNFGVYDVVSNVYFV